MQELVPGWTAPTQEDIDRSVDNIPTLPPFPIPTKRPKPTSAIEERKDWLIKSIRESKGDYPKEMLNDFFLYWSELDANGLSMRFEKEQTWETSKRLRRWYMHSQKPSSNTPTPEPQRAVSPTPPKVEREQEPTIPYPEEPIPPKVEPTPPPPPTPKEEQPVEQATYSPQTLTIRFKAGDKVIRLKDGIFLLEQLSGNLKGSLSSKGAEILYETTDGDMVADKDLFKNKREALERTKLAGIPEERLTYGNKPIK